VSTLMLLPVFKETPRYSKCYCLYLSLRTVDFILSSNLYSVSETSDSLCGLSSWLQIQSLGSIPDATRFSEKWWVWNRIHSAS
jgi:hypothetical protein